MAPNVRQLLQVDPESLNRCGGIIDGQSKDTTVMMYSFGMSTHARKVWKQKLSRQGTPNCGSAGRVDDFTRGEFPNKFPHPRERERAQACTSVITRIVDHTCEITQMITKIRDHTYESANESTLSEQNTYGQNATCPEETSVQKAT